MHNMYKTHQCPYYPNVPMYNPNNMYNGCKMHSCPYCTNQPMYNIDYSKQLSNQYNPLNCKTDYYPEFNCLESVEEKDLIELKDYGPKPFAINIDEATKQNNTFRTALWTGCNLQVTLMSIHVGDEIGLEVHPSGDQFIRIEEGEGLVKMGDSKCKLDFEQKVFDDFAIMIPAGKWHNIINTGDEPLKLYAIYAPPEHPRGTVHVTKPLEKPAQKNCQR